MTRPNALRPTAPHRARRAFTMTEVLVTALVILIIAAISVPQFDVGTTVGTDRMAQTTADAAMNSEMGFYRDAGNFTSTASDLTNINPDISYTASGSSPSTTSKIASASSNAGVLTNGANLTGVAVKGSTGCWLERRSDSPASSNDATTLYGFTTTGACTGAAAMSLNGQVSGSTTNGLSWQNAIQY